MDNRSTRKRKSELWGVADLLQVGLVMASFAIDSRRDKDIRWKLVEIGHVDMMVNMGNNFFYTKSLPCSLRFFDVLKCSITCV